MNRQPDKRRYWFRAKAYGWGWGLPIAWQGWVVLVCFILLVAAGAVGVLPYYGPFIFFACMVLLVAALVAICWITGEPPRWRWGSKDRN